MADTKITALSADASPTSTDITVTVDDVSGTPTNKKVTLANLITKAHGLSDGIIKVASSARTIVTAPSGTIVGTTDTQTVSAKRITPRVDTVASSATPAINTDITDLFTITALAANITSMTTSLSGTPTNGDKLTVRILDNGTARTIAWGASFASRGVALPVTTVISKYLYVGLIWNSATTTWDCVAVSLEA